MCIKFNDQRRSQIFSYSIPPSQSNKQSPKLIPTLLLISGNVELNPGPTNIKYPYGQCARAVKFGQFTACNHCNVCYQESTGMNSTIFECYARATIEMQWTCIKCKLISASLFDSSMSFINLSLNLDEEMLHVKLKFLRLVSVKFQSIYNKKDELSSFLIENDVDIVLGSKTHLSPSINNAKFPPPCTLLTVVIEQMVGVK